MTPCIFVFKYECF